MPQMNALLISPEFPTSYWGYQHALEFVDKKSVMPPLGLLTVAGMFPEEGYNLRLVDMNIEALTDADLEWADAVFTSTMIVQQQSLVDVAKRCREAGTPVVAGGPHPTSFSDELDHVDHLVLGEVENSFANFLADWSAGKAERIYDAPAKPDVSDAPVPRYDLLKLDAYDSMASQFSRGCPFDCEFCDITKLFGRVPRTKSDEQMLAEFNTLYDLGWRGGIFLVDDNFIGNKRDAQRLLTAVAAWQKERGYPFHIYTEASVNLAAMDDLMDTMVDAGFNMVFLGIETPTAAALAKTKKGQNVKAGEDNFLLEAIRKIQHKGIEVAGGFILGLDGEDESVFDAQIDFIQEAGIVRAMVGLLTALRGTDLYKRLGEEGRLLHDSTGNNVEITLNFVPEIDPEVLVAGYKRVLTTLYDGSLKNYFARTLKMYEHLNPDTPANRIHGSGITKRDLVAVGRSIRRQVFSRQGPAYLSFLAKVLVRHPRMIPAAVTSAIIGYHFEKVTALSVTKYEFKAYLERELHQLQEFIARVAENQADHIVEAKAHATAALARVQKRYARIQVSTRRDLRSMLEGFHSAVDAHLAQLEPVPVRA
jgi:radical SAM superfamily enzyme YgiQ (UPF0313 family)